MKKISTDKAPKAEQVYSQAIVSNGLVFVAGQIPLNIRGELVGETLLEKLTQIFNNISSILSEAGTEISKIVKVTVYVTDIAIVPEINQIYPTFLGSVLPAREAVCVKALPLGAEIEISVVAEL